MLRGLRAAELLRFLLAASIVGPSIIFLVVAWFTYQAAMANAEREIVRTSEVAREHAAKVFDSFRLVTERVEDALDGLDDAQVRSAEASLHQKFLGFIEDLPQIQSFVVLDREAHPLVATAAYPVEPTTDFSDRDYVRALKGDVTQAYISKVQLSRISGKLFFGWGRARHAVGGGYAGVIDIAISPDVFMRFYQTLVSEAGANLDGRVVTMIRDDGQILVRYPGFEGPPVLVPPGNPFFEAVHQNPDGGVYSNRSVVDRGAPARLFSFRKVPGHPIYTVAGLSIDTVVSGWWHSMVRYLAVGVPATAALFVLTLATARGAGREQAALAKVRSEMDRREQVEDQLRQAQKMEAVGQLTGGIAHDFNNLLTVIRSSVDQLRRSDLPDERRRRYIEAISDTTTRATKLTGQLLAFARRQALKPEVFDAVANVEAIGEMVRTLTGSRIAVETRLPPTPLHIHADPSQFDTAIVNMAVNARDAMTSEGRLVIAVGAVDAIPALRSRPAVAGAHVAVAIIDGGTGIAPEHLEMIFEPFFTTKEVGQGTGLGLSQVFGFAKQSGGEIAVESEPGRGTTFTLYLPRVRGPDRTTSREDAAPAPSAPPIDGRGRRILVVEDDPDVGAFASHALADLGFNTVWVTNADAAMAELDRDAKGFDVVFTDVVMPGRDGLDFAEDVRRRHAGLPVVLTSGYSHVLAQNGTSGFELLHKPYSIDQLSDTLRRAARARRSQAP